MASIHLRTRSSPRSTRSWVLLCTAAIQAAAATPLAAQQQQSQQQGTDQAQKLPAEQLDSLVAPIALYPDELLAQVLVASTYPLEVIQLQQWLSKNKGLKDEALANAVAKQDWDPSVQALAPLPDVVKRLAEDIAWTTKLGNAFLAQPGDVKQAVQRMRKKAQDKGNLKTTKEQEVQTQTVQNETVIVIEQADPQVVYVPTYNPTAVYGPPVYPYPAIYYPPPGYYAAGMAISFGVGLTLGAAWGGGWGWNAGWGHTDIDINRNNVFVSNYNRRNTANQVGRDGRWQHNPRHRGAAPYADRAVADRYGGVQRGEGAAAREARPGAGERQPRTGTMERGAARADRAGGGDRVGNRTVPSPRESHGAFSGAAHRTSGDAARMSSARGASSMRGFRGGGGRRR